MPDFYSVPVPVIPVRPGVYPSPVSYDGSYGTSPMSFCNHNEKDFDDSPIASMHHSEKGSSQKKPMRENGWEVDHRKEESEDISKSVIGKETPSQYLCNQQGQISVAPVNLPERKTNVVDESLLKKPGPLASPSKGLQHIFVIKKDVALIDKMKGLNIKVRIYDGSIEARPTREEKEKLLGIMNPKGVLSTSGSIKSVVLKEKSNASGAFNPLHKGSMDAYIVDGGSEPIAVGRVLTLATQHSRQIWDPDRGKLNCHFLFL